MNERIRELAAQADAHTKSEYDKWVPTLDFYTIPNQEKIFNEKFAELIIEDCMACSRWVGKVNTHAGEPIHIATAINKRIKQWFGLNG